jgi:fatty-acyl-CoA synthase
METVFPAFPKRADVVSWWARIHPGRVALIDRARDERLTYEELDLASGRLAQVFREQGIGRGDRVGVLAGNRVELLMLFGAALRTGAVLVPLNWRLAASELAGVLADAEPVVLIGESRFRAVAEQAAASSGITLRWIDLDGELPRLARRADAADGSAVDAEPEAPTMILYTSGSTGAPKGVVLPHRQLFYNSLATTIGWELGPTDIAPVANPCFHTGGWHVFTMPLLHVGGTVVLFEKFDPETFLDAIAEEACTVAFSVPTQIAMLTGSPGWGMPLPSLRFLISGGAPCPPALAARVRAAGIRFREGFGLTECGPNCFAISDLEAERRPGAVGWPSPFLEMRLLTVDGHQCAVDEPGELLVRGPQMFAGYFRNPSRTADVLDNDGWLHTGDLASRDADGAFRIRGRMKDMYISGGENVFPGEVEAVLCECEGVAEVVVVGVADSKWGEVGRAFVVTRPGSAITGVQVIAHARSRLAGYKIPKEVILVEEIPRLGSGKIDRASLATLEPASPLKER